MATLFPCAPHRLPFFERRHTAGFGGLSTPGLVEPNCRAKNDGLRVDSPIWVFPKIGFFFPKMDGENNGKPYEQMDDLGGFPPIFGNTHITNIIFLPFKGMLRSSIFG